MNIKNLLFLFIGIIPILIFSCSTENELIEENVNKISQNKTSSSSNTITIENAKRIAAQIINFNTRGEEDPEVEFIKYNNISIRHKLLSDTLAYVIQYKDREGFAIIANDNRIDPILAYSNNSNIDIHNELIKSIFINKIELYLASISDSGNNISNYKKRIIIEPQIADYVQIGPTSPLDKVVISHYPNCHAGFVNVATATVISHFFPDLVYKGYHYNFENIYTTFTYSIHNPLDPIKPTEKPSTIFNRPIPPKEFQNTYQGSVTAISQFLYDIGVSSNSYYDNNYAPDTPISGVVEAMKELGLEVTEINNYKENTLNDIYNLLNDGYLLELLGRHKNNDGSFVDIPLLQNNFGLVIDGCDVYVDSNGSAYNGYLHCILGMFELGRGFFSYPVLAAGQENYFDPELFIGIKN